MEAFVYCSFVFIYMFIGISLPIDGIKRENGQLIPSYGFSQVEFLNDTICRQYKEAPRKKKPLIFPNVG